MKKFAVHVLFFALLFIYCKKSDSTGAAGGGAGGVGAAAPYQTSADIGAAGGTIADPNGNWSLTIPAGALTQTKNITITTNATATGSIPADYTGTTATLSFEPHGLTFLSTATLKVKYSQGDMPEGGIEEKVQRQYYLNDDSTVTAMATTVNTATNEVTAQMPHFSFSATLTSSIKKVNNGTTTKPSAVRKVANQVISYYNGLATDALRSSDFNANWTLLYAFCQKLVAILGSDTVTAAFPNADWNLNSVINSLDPIVPISGAAVTLTSSGSLFVSTNSGAINSTQFVWRSSLTGTYSIRLNGTTCTDGTVLASGAVTATIDNTYTPMNASSLITGDNDIRVCVVAGGFTTFLLVTIARDEVYPVSSASPAGGTYSTAQNVLMNCSDTGGAICAQIAYTTNGTDPAFDIAGNVTNGTLVTGMWMEPASGATTLRVRSRDDAGNVGVVQAYSFVGPLSITYTGNGNTGGNPPVDAATYPSGSSATILGNTGALTKTGSVFLGWNTAADGSGNSYSPGASFVLGSADVTLNALWQFSLSSGPSPQANTWSSISYGAGVYVAVADSGTNQVMTSSDGITWTTRTAAQANPWRSVTYGGGVFVAVSASGINQVMTSPDGITWTSRTAAAANAWCSVTYGGGLFVAVASNGISRVMTSPDGIAWTSAPAAEQNGWNAVTYGNGLFVAVAPTTGAHLVMTSPDGTNWTARNASEASYWRGITYGNGTFVAIADFGSPNKVMTSPDGINWTSRTGTGSGYWSSVVYGKGLFVALSSSGPTIIMVSPDGVTWTTQNSAEAINWSSLGYGNGRFVSLSSSNNSRVMYSN